MALSIGIGRALPATMSMPSAPGSAFSKLRVGGATWSRKARTVKIASRPPAAPSRWPVADFGRAHRDARGCGRTARRSRRARSRRRPASTSHARSDAANPRAQASPGAARSPWRGGRRRHPAGPTSCDRRPPWCRSPRFPQSVMAPRASACSSSSITRMPAPSPMTKPSRSRSNGREARAGVVVEIRSTARGPRQSRRG